jgi:multiple sugar transport system substrate-binding protein
MTGAGLAGLSVLGLAGCGGGGQGQDGEMVFNMGPDQVGGLQEIVRRYNEQSEEGTPRVVFQAAPTKSDVFFDQLRNRFQAGESSPQIVGGDVIWPAQFAANGYIADLTDLFTDRDAFAPGPVASATYENRVYGLPWYLDVGLLYYRRDWLEDAGFSEPPQTWDELKEMAQQITQDNGRAKYGFVFQGDNYEGGVCNGLEYVRTHGGDATDPDDPSRVVIGSQEAVDGLATYRSMIANGIAPQLVTTATELESQTPFLQGESVFIRNWPYLYALLSDEEQSRVAPDQVGVVPLPTTEGGELAGTLGGWNTLINANAPDPEAAYRFAEFVASPEIQKWYAIEGKFNPTRTALLDDGEIQEAVPYLESAGEAFETARPRPVSPVYSDMSLVMAEQFNRVLTGDAEPQQAVETMQGDLENIVQQAS